MSIDERLHHLFARFPDVKVHLYGKAERPARKVGHVTVLGDGHGAGAGTGGAGGAVAVGGDVGRRVVGPRGAPAPATAAKVTFLRLSRRNVTLLQRPTAKGA